MTFTHYIDLSLYVVIYNAFNCVAIEKMKRKITKKKSVADSASRNAAMLTDGCNPELVVGAKFDGIFEIPVIKKPKKIVIPNNLVPFSKMAKADPNSFAVCEYENDSEFKDLLINPEIYVKEIAKYEGFITPDCSIYRDMPFAAQVTNIYRSRAIGYYMQKNGIYVIPNIRWGDERTYSTKLFSEPIAFAGIEKNSIISVGSYGQIKDKVNKYYFEAGFDAMMKNLSPTTVLIYGVLPEEIGLKYPELKIVEYPDWVSLVRKEN